MSLPVHALYGTLPAGLIETPPEPAVQCSPLIPGSARLEEFAPGSLASAIVLAPASTLERRYVIARALEALSPGAPLILLAPNDKGGTRLAAELEAFGCTPDVTHKRHHRIVHTRRPDNPAGLDAAISAGEPCLLPELGLWSQPGLFNWDRIDPGSQLLLDHLPPLAGRGADLGCGLGVIARAVAAASPALRHLTLIDIDRRAVDLAARNVPGDAISTLWADVRHATNLPSNLDFIVMNPPFHDGGAEDRALGIAFIQKAASMLRPGGFLWMTANRHLPYEATLTPLFATLDQVAQAKGFKIYSAQKSSTTAKLAANRPGR